MRKRILLLLGTLTLPAVHAQQCTGVAEALEVAHTRSLVESLSSQLYDGAMRGAAMRASPQQQAVMAPIMKRAFDGAFEPKSVYADLEAIFTRHCRQSQLDAYMVLARTHTFSDMDRLESAPRLPGFQAEYNAFGAHHEMPSPARVALMQRIDTAMGSTDMVVGLVQSFYRASDPSNKGSISSRDLSSVRQAVSQQVGNLEVFIYRTVSDEDLLSYVQFLEKPYARWFYQTYQASFMEMLERRMKPMMHQMMSDIQAYRTAQP